MARKKEAEPRNAAEVLGTSYTAGRSEAAGARATKSETKQHAAFTIYTTKEEDDEIRYVCDQLRAKTGERMPKTRLFKEAFQTVYADMIAEYHAQVDIDRAILDAADAGDLEEVQRLVAQKQGRA